MSKQNESTNISIKIEKPRHHSLQHNNPLPRKILLRHTQSQNFNKRPKIVVETIPEDDGSEEEDATKVKRNDSTRGSQLSKSSKISTTSKKSNGFENNGFEGDLPKGIIRQISKLSLTPSTLEQGLGSVRSSTRNSSVRSLQ